MPATEEMADKTHLLSLNYKELQAFMATIGAQPYRAQQVAHWIYKELVGDFEEMTDLPKSLRDRLEDSAVIYTSAVAAEAVSKDNLARKWLLRLADGQSIETVLLLYEQRRSVCVSTQVGCSVACSFCATGAMGFTRNLTPGEIVEQVLQFARWLHGEMDSEITNIVFMGMGEPLLNYDSLWKAIRNLHDPELFDLGARRMTVSTSGIVPRIRQFAKEDLPVGLAISLNAPDDELRRKLMPIDKRYPLEDLIAAAREYTEVSHRRITFEYALIDGVNDSTADARRLGNLLRSLLCHVNLIPVNPVSGAGCQPPPREKVNAFKALLDKMHIPNTIRLGRGVDIQAACGQLKAGQAGRKRKTAS